MAEGETDVKLFQHLGGAWKLSVTVEIRKFFMTQDAAIKPTRTGFCNSSTIMGRVQQLAIIIKVQNAKIAEAQPCWMQDTIISNKGRSRV